ncbi:uncharacterized protein LOC127836559 [Dreissena polymorpha]|uniref:Chitin-binding type-2 domain-containing protein n=1 Tax=Dreissena polymorpha TaxID=45954 RepID=A0A9D4MXL6_DREPO|nr:uncharacterized protein LOC127836559 [Dreissena polymorpha]KAH3884213.1 hypothetical protein DPMN_008188 [Dreissena polymorpha]
MDLLTYLYLGYRMVFIGLVMCTCTRADTDESPIPVNSGPSCDFMALPGYPDVYVDTVFWTSFECPRGHIFANALCDCVPDMRVLSPSKTTISPTTSPSPTTTRTTTTTTTTPTTTTTVATKTIKNIPSVCAGCRFDNGIGYKNHETECDLFVTCYTSGATIRGEVRRCGVGKFWDQALLMCRASTDVTCKTDVCHNKAPGYMYGHKANCRAFWTCEGGVSVGQCCPSGQGFTAQYGCMDTPDCLDTCMAEAVAVACDKETVAMDRTKFRQRVPGRGSVEMSCAAGTVFRQDSCDCQYDDLNVVGVVKACRKEFEMTFDDDKLADTSGYNIHLYHENVTMATGQACFHGDGVIVIPRFSNAYLGTELEVSVTFKLASGSGPGLRAIVYNGDCGMDPSIVIAASEKELMFLLRNESNHTITLTSYINSKGWIKASFTLHKNRMAISLNGLQVTTALFHGNVAVSRCGLKLGWGEEFQTFQGCLEYVSLALCVS